MCSSCLMLSLHHWHLWKDYLSTHVCCLYLQIIWPSMGWKSPLSSSFSSLIMLVYGYWYFRKFWQCQLPAGKIPPCFLHCPAALCCRLPIKVYIREPDIIDLQKSHKKRMCIISTKSWSVQAVEDIRSVFSCFSNPYCLIINGSNWIWRYHFLSNHVGRCMCAQGCIAWKVTMKMSWFKI